MARLTKEEKRIEKEVEAAFKLHGNCIQFNIFDLGKISKAGREAGKVGGNIEDAVKAAIQVYRQN